MKKLITLIIISLFLSGCTTGSHITSGFLHLESNVQTGLEWQSFDFYPTNCSDETSGYGSSFGFWNSEFCSDWKELPEFSLGVYSKFLVIDTH